MSIINLLLGNKESKISISIPHYTMKYEITHSHSKFFYLNICFYVNDHILKDITIIRKKITQTYIKELKEFINKFKNNGYHEFELIDGIYITVSENKLMIEIYWDDYKNETEIKSYIELELSDHNRIELAKSFSDLYNDCKYGYDKYVESEKKINNKDLIVKK